MNQLGEVQPIGGVNEKIEGFFESCVRRGLTGKQGVIIPARNTKHLALRRDVVEAVEAGQFTIYGVNTIEEAVELLSGVPAGERGLDGEYPPDTVYGRAAQRLVELAEALAEWGEGEAKTEGHIITEL
jgi:predicted ATP-dependent protease